MPITQPFLDVQVASSGVVGRRGFFKTLAAGGAGALALSWRDLAIARAAELRKSGKRMILLWMDGGPSQFESFNPKPGSENQGPCKANDTALPGVQFAEFWPQMAKHADKFALIRSMQTGEADHARAIKLVKSGYPPTPALRYPTWGSALSESLGAADFDLPAYVRVLKPRIATRDIDSGVLGARHSSFNIDEPGQLPSDVVVKSSSTVLARRLALADRFDAEFAAAGGKQEAQERKEIYDRTARFVQSPKLGAFRLDEEPAALRDAYGRTPFGQGCLLARRLVETGVSFVEVIHWGQRNDQGWDTHKTGFADTEPLCREVDPAYATLLTDLEQRGLLENTLVVWMGEFGRTPKLKADGGRDHYATGWCVGLSGAGVRVGQVIGATDKDGVKVTDRPIGVPDLYVTFCKSLGLDPHHEYHTPDRRPIKLVEGGKVIEGLLG